MECGIEKFAMVIMKSGKQYMTEGIQLPNQDQKTWTNRNLQILGNIRNGQHQTCGDERKKLKK